MLYVRFASPLCLLCVRLSISSIPWVLTPFAIRHAGLKDAGILSFALASNCVTRVPGRVAGSAVSYRGHFVCFHLLLGLALLSHLAVTVRPMLLCCLTAHEKDALCFRSFVLWQPLCSPIHTLDGHEFCFPNPDCPRRDRGNNTARVRSLRSLE